MISIVPVATNKSIMQYDFDRSASSSDASVLEGIDFFEQVEKEDK
jgi:hypothetical protein